MTKLSSSSAKDFTQMARQCDQIGQLIEHARGETGDAVIVQVPMQESNVYGTKSIYSLGHTNIEGLSVLEMTVRQCV